MSVLEARIPPPLVMLACAGLMWLLARIGPAVGSEAARTILAIALGGTGVAFLLAGTLSFHRARTTINPLKPEAATALVTSGVYRVTRNPMYLGFLSVLLGWACWLGAPLALAGPILFVAWIDRLQIAPEERALRARFGTAFDEYRKRVRRWL